MRKLFKSGMLSLILFGTVFVTACGTSNTTNQPTNQGSSNKPVAKKDFTYAMSGLYKPFNYKENGTLTGFDVEVGKALAEKMGMNPVPVTNPWETIIQGLLAKKYDAILGSMTVTDKRKEVVNFTQPYYRSGSQVFVAQDNQTIKSINDLKGKTVGVVKASTYKDLAKKYAGKVVEYDSDLTALMDLPTGRLNAVITDKIVGIRVINEKAIKIKDVGPTITTDDQAIAVRKDDPELLAKLNKALDEIIKDGTYDKISKKWFGRNILGNQ